MITYEKRLCLNCIYRSYDSWNNPNGWFCERKTINEFDENDFMASRIEDNMECNETLHYGIGDIEYGYEREGDI